ncbi:MAG: hypothetical protein IJD31_04970, partial [Lachnospiraceae bacterium]|nr:hypothetical protein [Lachnospiraceae bacterium]
RQYKNNLFVYLFTRKKKYALSLYNAMNCTDYTNEEDLEFFREYGEEIIGMEWYEVTQEMIWEIQREEAIEDARAEGMEEGRLLGRKECEAEMVQKLSVAEKTILALQQEIENLKRGLLPKIQ